MGMKEMTEYELKQVKEEIGLFLTTTEGGEYLRSFLEQKILSCMKQAVIVDDSNEKFKASGGFSELNGVSLFFDNCVHSLEESTHEEG